MFEGVAAAMMAAPFLAFVVSLVCAWRGRQRAALGVLLVAIGLSLAMFAYHVSDPLKISL